MKQDEIFFYKQENLFLLCTAIGKGLYPCLQTRAFFTEHFWFLSGHHSLSLSVQSTKGTSEIFCISPFDFHGSDSAAHKVSSVQSQFRKVGKCVGTVGKEGVAPQLLGLKSGRYSKYTPAEGVALQLQSKKLQVLSTVFSFCRREQLASWPLTAQTLV